MYIHGGFWRALDKKRFSFVAPALVEAGITVAVVDYALCPSVQVADIVMQMVQASAWLYRNGGNFGRARSPAHRLRAFGGRPSCRDAARLRLAEVFARLAEKPRVRRAVD